MAYTCIHQSFLESVVEDDMPSISKSDKLKIKKAIEVRLVNDPVRFGKPLQYSLKGSHSRSGS